MNPFRPLPVALRQGSGSRETPVARAPCERVPGRRWLDPRQRPRRHVHLEMLVQRKGRQLAAPDALHLGVERALLAAVGGAPDGRREGVEPRPSEPSVDLRGDVRVGGALGKGREIELAARDEAEDIGDGPLADLRGDADGGEVARDTARRIGPADRAGGDEERYGHALAATLEDPDVPANKTRGRKQRPCRVTIGSRRWRVLRRGPERRDEGRSRRSGAARPPVDGHPPSLDGELGPPPPPPGGLTPARPSTPPQGPLPRRVRPPPQSLL